MIRVFDFTFALCGLIVLSPLLFVIFVIGLFDTHSPVFFQQRVGKKKLPFTLIKFRTMAVSTESVPSHIVDANKITRFGVFLRRTKLDEIPQLINVLLGDMSLVGPRPNLFNQTELIEHREKRGVYEVLPGITGLAQIKNIDMSTPKKLAKQDQEMIGGLTLRSYISVIYKTIVGHGSGDAVAAKNKTPQ